jgi:hypothetical protein
MQNTASFRYRKPYERTSFAKQERPCLSSPQTSGVHGQPAETPMSGSPAAAIPCIDIPRDFEGATLSKFADAVVAACPDGWPPELVLDFDKLNFIQPAGVIFLSNLICWLNEHGTTVQLINANRDNVEALRHLDDSRFFEQHCGSKIWERSAPRSTTIPLQVSKPRR